jgi:ABC-type transport system substrate-binding protein
VRQAVQHAVENEAIVKAIFYGEAEPANQWIYKGHWGYNPAVNGRGGPDVGEFKDPYEQMSLYLRASHVTNLRERISVLIGQGYVKG